MFRTFEAATADLAWQQIAAAFRSAQFNSGQSSRSGGTSEILHAAITISEPRQRWVASRRPALNVAFALVEVIWILRGRNDSAFLNYFNRELPKYAGCGPTYHGAYGSRLRKMFGFDQLERAYLVLKQNPASRQTALQIWNPNTDFPDTEGRAVDCDIPCNMSSLLKVRHGKLEWLQVMRSNDVFRGLPYNLVQFTTLQEIMAGWLGLEVGEYHQISDSLHIYDESSKHVMSSMPLVAPNNTDNLAISKTDSDLAFEVLERLVEELITEKRPLEEVVSVCTASTLLVGYQNIARILCAEAARRRDRLDVTEQLLFECTNPALTQLYAAWLDRVEKGVSDRS